jgi:hypothetical protein
MSMNNRSKYGIVLAVGVIAGRVSLLLAFLLLLVAAFLIAWDRNPARTQEVVLQLPFGDRILKGLAKVDSLLS